MFVVNSVIKLDFNFCRGPGSGNFSQGFSGPPQVRDLPMEAEGQGRPRYQALPPPVPAQHRRPDHHLHPQQGRPEQLLRGKS